MRLVSIAGDHERRTAKLLHHPRGGDANHATMPAISVHHDAVSVAKRGVLLEPRFDLLQNAALFLLPFAVQLVEADRNITGNSGILHTEEINNIFRNIHATRG